MYKMLEVVHSKSMRFFIFVFGLLTLSACSNKYLDVRYVRSVGLTDHISNLKQVGIVRSEDCSWKILNTPITPSPSFDDVLDRAVSLKEGTIGDTLRGSYTDEAELLKTKIKLLTNIQTRSESWNFYLIGKECLKLSAIAYQ